MYTETSYTFALELDFNLGALAFECESDSEAQASREFQSLNLAG